MTAINRATDWEKGRTILKIGRLLVRHGYRDDPTWRIIDYYWNGKYVMTSARRYVVIERGDTVHTFGLFYAGRLLFHECNGEVRWSI